MAASTNPYGSSLSSYKPSSNTENVPWYKNRSNGRSIYEYEVVEENDDSPTDMFSIDQSDEKAFGKWLNPDLDEVTNLSEKDSQELLDDNYPPWNPPRSYDKYEPIKFFIDSTKSERKSQAPEYSSWDEVEEVCNFDDTSNELKTTHHGEPKTPYGEPKKLHHSEPKTPHRSEPKTPRRSEPKTPRRVNLFDDDDVITLDEDLRTSQTSVKLSHTIDSNISNVVDAIKNKGLTYSAQKIPVLTKEHGSSSTMKFNVPKQFNLPPPGYSEHPFEVSSNSSNPFVTSFNQSNSGVYNQYGISSLMTNPPPPNQPFFNPSDPRITYSQPASNNWTTSMNPMVPNIRSIRQIPINGNVSSSEDTAKKLQKSSEDDAIKNEIRQQNLNLMVQRETYFKKYAFLNDELEKLIKQKKDLVENKKAERYLKANQELQSDIQNKMKAVKNVIDMLSKIIKDDDDLNKSAENYLNETRKIETNDEKKSSSSNEKKLKRKSRSRSRSKHRSRSRSRGRRSRSPRQRSRSYSPKRQRRRTHSRERNYGRRRTPEKYRRRSKEKKFMEKKSQKMSMSKSIVQTDSVPPKEESPKSLKNFKSTFEEVKKSVMEVKNNVPKAKTDSRQQHVIKNVNYVHYDPEIHWCQVCDVFPKTAKEYLLHLHDQKHKDELTKRNMIDYPWHKMQTSTPKPVYPDAPTERIPIRGLPFFVSAAAWYCKLCNEWMGDLHCASTHLKSDEHEKKYKAFVTANILWEETWAQSRAKAIELCSRAQAKQNDVTCAAHPSLPTVAVVEVPCVNELVKPLYTRRKSSSSSSSSSSDSESSSDIDSKNSNRMEKKSIRSKSKNAKKSLNREKSSARTSADMRSIPLSSPKGVGSPVVEMGTKTREENDKFVDEWMQHPARDHRKEREIEELKNKLRRKEAEEKTRAGEKTKTSSGDRRHISPSPPRSSRPHSPQRPEKSSGKNFTRGPSSTGGTKKMLEKPITIGKGKFPFIGKMPFRARKSETSSTTMAGAVSDAKSAVVIKAGSSTSLPPPKNSELSEAIKKQIQEYEKALEGGEDTTVVDMDINEDEEDVTSAVIPDDNDSRKKDFEVALKLLYPEEKSRETVQSSTNLRQQFTHVPPVMAPVVPQNLTQDYLVSLIESTLMEKLKLGFRPANDMGVDLQSSSKQLVEFMAQSLMAPSTAFVPAMIGPAVETQYPPSTEMPPVLESMVTDIPIPHEVQANLPVAPTGGQPWKEKVGATVISESDATARKKKKNPISQKKRRHLAKLRRKLEEQEKELQAKIEETKKNMAAVVASDEGGKELISEFVVMNDVDSDLMLLGIDESDSAALQF